MPSPLDNCNNSDFIKTRELDFVVKHFDEAIGGLRTDLNKHNARVEEMYSYYVQKKTEDKLKGGIIKTFIGIAGAIAGALVSGAR